MQQKDEFVGTESRFLQIFSLLKEIRDRSTTDVETRIAQLEQDRDRLQQEIDRIRQTGAIDLYNQTQLQERFFLANQVTRQLIADFRDIEQNFRNLTRTIKEAQLQQDARKGAVVSRVLDAERELKESDQGRSFYAFWNFLMSNSKRQELRSLIEDVYKLEEIQPLTREYGLLRRIERNLIDAGEYIVQSNQQSYPVSQGLPEVVAYLAIALRGDRHSINTSTIDSITISSLKSDKQLHLTLPQVIFRC